MVVLGLILLLIGFFAGIPLLVTIGVILLIVGCVFLVIGATGRAIGGRRYWY